MDDEPLNLMLFEKIFRNKFDVVTARTPEEGLDKIKEHPSIPIVLSDLKMPGMNGMEFIKKAKTIDSNKIYFILSGYEITDEITLAIENKIIEKYFRKPYDFKEIEAAIDEVLSKQKP